MAVNQNGNALLHVSMALQADREVVLTAVAQTGCAIRYASRALKADREVMLTAITQDHHALQYQEGEYEADRAFILDAVRINGLSLRFIDAIYFENDAEIITAAAEQNIASLQYASPEMREKYKAMSKEINQTALMVTSLFRSKGKERLTQLGEEATKDFKKHLLRFAVSNQGVFSASTLERKISDSLAKHDETAAKEDKNASPSGSGGGASLN